MAVLPDAGGVLLLLFAVCCSSPRKALICLLTVSVLLLLGRLLAALMRRISLPLSTGGAMLLSLGVGSAVCLGLRVWIDEAPSPTEPLTAALLLAAGAFSRRDTVPAARILPAVLVVGVLRELLGSGSLWGIDLLPMELSRSFGNGVGGLLIGALVLWGFGLRQPLFSPAGHGCIPTAALLTLLGSTLGMVTAPLPPLYALWIAAAAVCLADTLLPARYAAEEWVAAAPLAALLTRGAAWWLPLAFAAAIAAVIPLIAAVCGRIRLAAVPQRFAGVPLALTVSAAVSGLATVF